MRAFSSRRHSPRRPRAFGPTEPSTRSTSTTQPSDLDDESPGTVAYTGIAPGWLVDPSGRHEKRYWSGSEWTEHVTDAGIPSSDPPPGRGDNAS
jgi:hypothetical protein